MSIQTITNYFIQYGAFFIYLIVLLEYMNLPGFPAGVIMPLAGIWAAKGAISFPIVMVLTVAAGLTGSWILYLLGRLGGPKVMGFYFKKFPKHQAVIEEKMEFLREKHRSVCEQTPSDGQDADLHTGGNGKDGFCEIYLEFAVRHLSVEPGIRGCRIFLRGSRDQFLIVGQAAEKTEKGDYT